MQAVKVSTRDNEIVSLPIKFVNMSGVLRDLVSDLGEEHGIIPLINIHSDEVVQLEQLVLSPQKLEIDTDIPIEERYVSLSELIKAANYLEITPLIDFLSEEFAKLLKETSYQDLEILEKKI
jgi:hypothetical protein